jgi:hypothetical protein
MNEFEKLVKWENEDSPYRKIEVKIYKNMFDIFLYDTYEKNRNLDLINRDLSAAVLFKTNFSEAVEEAISCAAMFDKNDY